MNLQYEIRQMLMRQLRGRITDLREKMPMTADELKSEITQCLKAGPAGWTQAQATMSPVGKWLVSAARGQRDVPDIAVDFKKKFGRTITQTGDEERDVVREFIPLLRAQQSSLRQWKEGNQKDILFACPAAELVFSGESDEAALIARWRQAGGMVSGKRCIALKSSSVWAKFSEFGQPYPPFTWDSTLDVMDVDLSEARTLGLIAAPEKRQARNEPSGGALTLFALLGIGILFVVGIVAGFM